MFVVFLYTVPSIYPPFLLSFFLRVFITMTSQWARLRLKSPTSRLFTQRFIQAQIKENIKASRHWLCEGNSPVNSPHKGPVTRKLFPFDDVIMSRQPAIYPPTHSSTHQSSSSLPVIHPLPSLLLIRPSVHSSIHPTTQTSIRPPGVHPSPLLSLPSYLSILTPPYIWGLCCQKQVSQAGISNYIPQFTVGCNYLSLPEIPASGNKALIYALNTIQNGRHLADDI